MDTNSLRNLLDICFVAKHVTETLPELPTGMKPRHIHVLDAVNRINNEGQLCRVSDVSRCLNITTPSVSKLIRELEEQNMLKKKQDETDGRVTYVYLTNAGHRCVNKHITVLHGQWAAAMPDVTNEEVEQTVRTITRLYETILEGRKNGNRSQTK